MSRTILFLYITYVKSYSQLHEIDNKSEMSYMVSTIMNKLIKVEN